jgi:hypothetical protein
VATPLLPPRPDRGFLRLIKKTRFSEDLVRCPKSVL